MRLMVIIIGSHQALEAVVWYHAELLNCLINLSQI